ncbi:MAG: hypothetical protein ACFHWZ_08130 [Phycisphaerales bacterium]
MAFACRFVCIIFLAAFAPLAGAGTSVSVSIDPQIAGGPVTGRIVVYLISEADAAESRRLQRASPASGPFFSDPQPMYGFDVTDLVPGIDVLLTDRATSFPVVWSNLPAGTYRAGGARPGSAGFELESRARQSVERHRRDRSGGRGGPGVPAGAEPCRRADGS